VTGAEIVRPAPVGPKRQSEKGKIKRLPPTLRAEFERRLMEGAFSDYRGLSRWLAGHGYHISHAALHKHGHALERKLDALRLATEQARVVVEASGAADDAVGEGLMRLVQGDLFRVLVELKEVDAQKVDLNALARNVASICRAAVQMRRTADERRGGIGKRVLAAERKVVAAARRGTRGGLSQAAEQRIRAALLEIAELPAALDDDPTTAHAQSPRDIGESAPAAAGADAAAGAASSGAAPSRGDR
jgi:hypothetical protein